MSSDGRPQSVTQEQVLDAVAKYQTVSPSTIGAKLKVSAKTIQRRMKQAGEAAVKAALGNIEDKTLRPAEMEYAVFKAISEIDEFYETLRFKREAGESYTEQMRRTLFRVCVALKTRPTGLTLEQVEAFVVSIKKGENKDFGSGYDVRRSLRSWFGFRGASMQVLTNMGIDAKVGKRSKQRATARLTQEQRHAILATAETMVQSNYQHLGFKIAFADQPNLALAMLEWFEFKYYTMTRSASTLNATWQPNEKGQWGVTFKEDMVIVRVVDKGKRGGLEWDKKLIGKAGEYFKGFWLRIGCPKEGRIFPFDGRALNYFLRECYAKAGIPEQVYKGMTDHIWRHTGAQDLLDATGWNRSIVAATGGWESEDVLKLHYGEVPPRVQENAIRKAMGLPSVEEKREFVF